MKTIPLALFGLALTGSALAQQNVVTAVVPQAAETPKFSETPPFFIVPGMYVSSMELKAALLFTRGAEPPGLREHINKTRWTKGQHKLPDSPGGYHFDLNGDGIEEIFIETGEYDGSLNMGVLVVRMDRGKPEIICALKGSFGLVRRDGAWHDIVEFRHGRKPLRAKTGMRFDGVSYRRIWRCEQAEENSEPKMVEGKEISNRSNAGNR